MNPRRECVFSCTEKVSNQRLYLEPFKWLEWKTPSMCWLQWEMDHSSISLLTLRIVCLIPRMECRSICIEILWETRRRPVLALSQPLSPLSSLIILWMSSLVQIDLQFSIPVQVSFLSSFLFIFLPPYRFRGIHCIIKSKRSTLERRFLWLF